MPPETSATSSERRAPRSFPNPLSAWISGLREKLLQTAGKSPIPRSAASIPPGSPCGENAVSFRTVSTKPLSNSPDPARPSTGFPSSPAPHDDGIAFRYSIPADAKGKAVQAAGDLTEYQFAGDFTAWFYNNEQHNLGPDKLSTLTGNRQPVMTVQAAENAFLALHEADLRSGDPLQLTKSGPTAFRALTAPGEVAPGYVGPWRVIFFGTTPGAMVDSHLIELLNPDPTGDFSWVKPGVCTWDWRIDGAKVDGFNYGMNYDSWVRMIDFSAANGMKHLVLDANWYGPEFAKDSDPVKGDKANDVKKIIAYGKTKNVGVWLYLNDVGGRKSPLE